MTANCRVLVVEDQPSKIAQVIALLVEQCSCNRSHIETAQSVVDAKRLLKTQFFDVMILDVVLPNRPENTPNAQGGIELLRELMERDGMVRPKYIIGLTAFPDAFKEAAGEFADFTWAIIQYDDKDQSWHDPIKQLTRHAQRTATQDSVGELTYQNDVCVVSALPMEHSALIRNGWLWTSHRVTGDAITYNLAAVGVGSDGIRVVAAVAPRMGMVSAGVLAANMIRTFRPRLIAIVGICAGERKVVEQGDILIADPSWDYQSGKLIGGKFEIAPHQLPLLPAIRRRLVETANVDFLCAVRKNWPGALPRSESRSHFGPFASGSLVLADRTRFDELKLQHRQLIGIDMETYGVYAAASEAPAPVPYAFAIKGVSDFGDETKSDNLREYAAYASAMTFTAFVESHYRELRKIVWQN